MKGKETSSPEAILVLGLQLTEDGKARSEMLLRARRAAELYRETGMPVIACGGETRPGFGTEAESLKAALISEGVPPERILLEGRSRITAENILNAKGMLSGGDSSAFLVTSDYHMLRAKLLCRRERLSVQGVKAKTPAGREKLCKRFLEAVFLLDLLLGFQGTGRARPKWLQAAGDTIVKPLYARLGQRYLPEYKNDKPKNGGMNQ